jgi:hypothetical protein
MAFHKPKLVKYVGLLELPNSFAFFIDQLELERRVVDGGIDEILHGHKVLNSN